PLVDRGHTWTPGTLGNLATGGPAGRLGGRLKADRRSVLRRIRRHRTDGWSMARHPAARAGAGRGRRDRCGAGGRPVGAVPVAGTRQSAVPLFQPLVPVAGRIATTLQRHALRAAGYGRAAGAVSPASRKLPLFRK